MRPCCVYQAVQALLPDIPAVWIQNTFQPICGIALGL